MKNLLRKSLADLKPYWNILSKPGTMPFSPHRSIVRLPLWNQNTWWQCKLQNYCTDSFLRLVNCTIHFYPSLMDRESFWRKNEITEISLFKILQPPILGMLWLYTGNKNGHLFPLTRICSPPSLACRSVWLYCWHCLPGVPVSAEWSTSPHCHAGMHLAIVYASYFLGDFPSTLKHPSNQNLKPTA